MVELLFGSVVDRGIVEDFNKDSRGLTLPTFYVKSLYNMVISGFFFILIL